jgi:hypothetical protein
VSVAKTKILGYYTIFGLDVKWFVFLCLKIWHSNYFLL